MDRRIHCNIIIGQIASCYDYILPTTITGEAQRLEQLEASIIAPNGLSVAVPIAGAAPDVIAFARGGTGFYSAMTGEGDRCPDYGVLDSATGKQVVRAPAPVPAVDKSVSDSTGDDLLGWRFQTFGDQFRLGIDYRYNIDPSNADFSGRIELDTDRDLNTGLVHTPFLVPSPFNEIPSWGWDVAIEFQGGGAASDFNPFSLDFGMESEFIVPPLSTYALPLFPLGGGYNDGRWYVSGNRVVLEGSLSLLDARRMRAYGAVRDIERWPSEGQVIGRLFTRGVAAVADMLPKDDSAFDAGAGVSLPAIRWNPGKMVSGVSPADRTAQFDLIKVDAQIEGSNLTVAGTLARLDPSWSQTTFAVLLETGTGEKPGPPVENNDGVETIRADYILLAGPQTGGGKPYVGYTTVLTKGADLTFREGHDSALNILFSDPSKAVSPAKFIVTIPLVALGNPQGTIRLHAATFAGALIDDVAPPQPLSVKVSGASYALTVTKAGTGVGTVMSAPAGISCGGDCSESYPAGTAVTLTAAPAAGSTFAGWSGACSGAGSCQVSMTAARNVAATFNAAGPSPAQTLIARYYQSILGRAPDAGGLAYWQSEIARLQGLGVDVREAFRVMAGQFFSSAEYLSRNTGDAQYVTDLYRTFFDRAPDGGGLSYWAGQLAAGLPRSVVLFSFVFSPEFAATMQGLFGDTASRGEVSAVVDFYRGFLNRLPDSGGFGYWLGRFRAAQCQGVSAVNAEVDTISRQFAASAEYVARNRNNRDYVADLYYGFLRRGGDLAGFNYWVGQIDAGALNRDQARARFLASAEFQTRVQQIIQQGCIH